MRRSALLAAFCICLVPAIAWSQGRMPNAGQMPGPGNRPMMGQGTGPWMPGQGMMGYGMMGYGMMGGGMMGAGPMGFGMMGYGMMGDADSHIDGRIAFLKAELKLDAAQAKLFEPVEKALRDSAAQHTAHPMPMMTADDSLPTRLDTMEKAMAERIETLRALKTAISPLYAALKPEQREIADRFLLPTMM
jgi:hypothetical protein